MSMGIIRMDPYDPMAFTRSGPQLLSLEAPGTQRTTTMMERTPNAWNAPSSSTAAMASKKTSGMTSSGSATVLSQVANALNPGAEVVLRMNVNAKTPTSNVKAIEK